jgi:iron complex outermembrane receptor protein
MDSTTGSPIVGASVTLENAKGGTKTDVEGNFFLSVEPGKSYTILLTSVGYQTKLLDGIEGQCKFDFCLFTKGKRST